MVCCHVNKTLNWLSSIELCLSLEIAQTLVVPDVMRNYYIINQSTRRIVLVGILFRDHLIYVLILSRNECES